MPFMPFNILGIWFRGLLAVAILAGGVYLLRRWYEDSHVVVLEPAAGRVEDRPADREVKREGEAVQRHAKWVFRWDPGWNRETGELAAGLALLAWAVAGRLILSGMMSLTLGSGRSTAEGSARPEDDPKSIRDGRVQRLRRPDGSEIHVETYGPDGAPTVILTHGWGLSSAEWYYVKTRLADRFRVVVWDLPGLGLSKKPDNNDYRLETLAADLGTVLAAAAGGRPAVLAGHSIGGMITLTFCKLFPESLGPRVAGLVLTHTTYTNPVRTTRWAALYTAIEKPVLVPLLYLTIGLWPLVWLMNWMSYINGSAHRSTHKQSFAGHETRGQLDFATRFILHARPDVLARGMLGMLAYDATPALAAIGVPTAVIAGDLDTTTTPEASEHMARTIPGARLVTLSPARHLGLIERHEAFERALAESVAQSLPAGTAAG